MTKQYQEPLSYESISNLYRKNLAQLVEQAHAQHQKHFPHYEIQASSLLSIKTGGCPENCAYCPQSAHYETDIKKTKLMGTQEVSEAAKKAKQAGASRFCMGAAWRSIKNGPDFDHILHLVKEVRSLGLEVCCTLGMLNPSQASRLKEAGLDFYNHNIDTSPEYYSKIIQTRTYKDRIQTLENVREAGIAVCTGGILGMGESEQDRISFILQLASFNPQPESITLNTLVAFEGTPLENQKSVDPLELLRVVATLRITNPKSMIRLSAGRLTLSPETQFLCFYCGANSLFLGDKLLTSPNPLLEDDNLLLKKTGYVLSQPKEHATV